MGRNIDADGLTAHKICTGIVVRTALLGNCFCSRSAVHVNYTVHYLSAVYLRPPENSQFRGKLL